MTEKMSCKELVELVTDYLENTLSETDRARLEAHLAGCDGCDAYVAQMKQTIEMVGELKEDDIPPEAEQELMRVFREWQVESGNQ
jgi:anti-sigma factor RsiW